MERMARETGKQAWIIDPIYEMVDRNILESHELLCDYFKVKPLYSVHPRDWAKGSTIEAIEWFWF